MILEEKLCKSSPADEAKDDDDDNDRNVNEMSLLFVLRSLSLSSSSFVDCRILFATTFCRSINLAIDIHGQTD